jgi:SecD/SecF fusion protein
LNRQLVWRVLLVLAVLGGSVALIMSWPIRLGLDLRGGTQIVLEARDTPQETVTADTVTRPRLFDRN